MVGRVIAGVFLVRVGGAAHAELAARVLPCLPVAVPMETKLRKLLANLGGGCFAELHPNPLADNLGEIEEVWINGVQQGQNLVGGHGAVFLPCLGINRQARVLLRCFRLRCLRLRHY